MGRKKKEIRLKEPVRIREKKIAGGNISLYLDIYQKGLRKKETLKLYLVPEINAATKLQTALESYLSANCQDWVAMRLRCLPLSRNSLTVALTSTYKRNNLHYWTKNDIRPSLPR